MRLTPRKAIQHLSLIFAFAMASNAAAAPSAELFGQLENVYDAAISPDGSQIALIKNKGGKYYVRVTDFEGNIIRDDMMGLQTTIQPHWVHWANNERILVGIGINTIVRDVPAVYTYITTQSLDEKSLKLLVESNGANRQFNSDVLNFLMDDPTYILMSIDNLQTKAPEVRKVDVKNGKFILVQKSDDDIQDWFADLDGNVRIGRGITYKTRNSKNPEYKMRVKAAGSDVWQSSEDFPGLDHETPIFGFSENPNELLIGSYAGKDNLGLYVYDLEKREVTKKLFHHDIYDVNSIVYSGDQKKVIGVRYVSETAEVVLFNEKGPKEKDNAGENRTPDRKHYRFLDQSKDGTKTLYEITGPNDSGHISIYDSVADEFTNLEEQYPGLTPSDLGQIFDVTYKARDGVEIPAYITLPPGLNSLDAAKNIPFITLPHGGPYARTSDDFDYFAQFFASRGFGVLQMNFRGSEGYGKAFKDSGRENWTLMLDDIEDGTRWLAAEGLSDPSKSCIAGWSFGGYAALMGAVNNADGLYQCAISIAGVTDLRDLVYDQKKYTYGQLSAKNSILSGFDGRKDLKAYSPTKRAEEINIPVFLAHGKFDQRVHFDQFTRMRRALKKADVPLTTREYDQDNHFMSIQKNRQDMFKALDKFLEKSVGKSDYAK